MSSPRKRWADHSARWKREALRDGMTPQRWNRWLNYSKEIKQQTDARRYAAGEPIQSQLLGYWGNKAIDKLMEMSPTARYGTVALGVDEMTLSQRKWTANASTNDIRRRARRKYPQGERNPWWYR